MLCAQNVRRIGVSPMRSTMRAAFAAVLVLASCPAGSKPTVHTPAQTVALPDAFARAKRTLIGRGLSIEDADEDAGVISTTWVEDKYFTGEGVRFRWVVTIDDQFVTVTSQCQMASGGGPGEYETCETQPEGRNAQAEEIANAIGQ